jgi:GTPase SAR1 family protein
MGIKLVVAGPPNSGKSCFKYGLKEALKKIPDIPYPFSIIACPDGEFNDWQQVANTNSKLAAELKIASKSGFTPSFTELRAEWVKNTNQDLVLIDIGGKPSIENERICQHATHAIILANERSLFIEWEEFCKKLGIKIIAKITSIYNDKSDQIPTLAEDQIYYGTVHHLERGDLSVVSRPTIKSLASILGKMLPKKRTSKLTEATQLYFMELDENGILQVNFNNNIAADNNHLIVYVEEQLNELIEKNYFKQDKLLKINGGCSLSLSISIAYKMSALYQAIAWFEPRLNKYLVSISNSDEYKIGQLVD